MKRHSFAFLAIILTLLLIGLGAAIISLSLPGGGMGRGLEAAPLPQATPGVTHFTGLSVTNNLEVGGLIDAGPLNTENILLPSVLSAPITYTAAAGGSGTAATIGDGEVWFVHKVFINVTTNFDCTDDDCTLTIGDDLDVDGFIAAADAQLQATFTEETGYAAGWYGIEQGSGGVYTLDDGGPFVYTPSGATQTIDWVLDETVGETMSAGELTIYIVYTRVQ